MSYKGDRLATDHGAEFLNDPEFKFAYARGVEAARDYKWEWRVHVALWVARQAIRLPGSFVECGTNRGFMASAIMRDLNWDSRQKNFYLCDTWEGIDERQLTDAEIRAGAQKDNARRLADGTYTTDFGAVAKNFSEWSRVKMVRGPVPETLRTIPAALVAFLHLDMNCAAPEVAALKFFWPRMTFGGFVLADDYCYAGYEVQGAALRDAARELGVSWLALPTGQGLLIRP